MIRDGARRVDCALCALVQAQGGHLPSGSGIVVVYVDDDLIALLQDDLPGVLLAPREHIGALSTFPERSARFLAALRRAVTEVRNSYGTSGAMIEPTTDVPGAAGHICYHVVPTMRDGDTPPYLDEVLRAQSVVEALQDRLSSRRLQPVLRSAKPASSFGRQPGLTEP